MKRAMSNSSHNEMIIIGEFHVTNKKNKLQTHEKDVHSAVSGIIIL